MKVFEAACFHNSAGEYIFQKKPNLKKVGASSFYFGTTLLSAESSLGYWENLKNMNGCQMLDDGYPNHQYGHPILLGSKLSQDLTQAANRILGNTYSTTFKSFRKLSEHLQQRTLCIDGYSLYNNSLTNQLRKLLEKGLLIPFVYDSILSFDNNKIVPKAIEMQSHIGYMTWSRDMYQAIPKNDFLKQTSFVLGSVIEQTKKLGSIPGEKPAIVLDLNPMHSPSGLDERGMHHLVSTDIKYPGSLYDLYFMEGELYIDLFDLTGQLAQKAVRLRDCSVVCRMLYDDIMTLKSNIGHTVSLGARKVLVVDDAFVKVQKLLTDAQQSFLWHTNWSYVIEKSDLPVLKTWPATHNHLLATYPLYGNMLEQVVEKGNYISKPSNGISGRGSFYISLSQNISIGSFLDQKFPLDLQGSLESDRYILQRCLEAAPLYSPHFDGNMNVVCHPSICEIRTMAFPGIGDPTNFEFVQMARIFPRTKYEYRNNHNLSAEQYTPTNMGMGTRELKKYLSNGDLWVDYRKSSYGWSPVVNI